MTIYRVSIPSSDYYGESCDMHTHYFESESSPTKNQVINYLKNKIENVVTENHPIAISVDLPSLQEQLCVGKCCKHFPTLYSSVIDTNTQINHPKFGRQPLSVRVIKPTKL